ncbi:MAG: helix-turn-helix domain-containing protein [Thermomicrobiaceae bacterium]|nr:helix-turn-helix domain-containing protein [Thermomicrobiaceae bacterium]
MAQVARSRPTYSVVEAAQILQFHPDAVRYWLRIGELPGERASAGEDWRIRPEDLVAFLRESGESLPGVASDR